MARQSNEMHPKSCKPSYIKWCTWPDSFLIQQWENVVANIEIVKKIIANISANF